MRRTLGPWEWDDKGYLWGHPGPGEELILRYRRMKQGDSQLIAAAPDLLEALERVLDEDVSDHAREIVEAAIAKATGRQG